MDHKQLQYFLTLAETLHFSRASERCFISAPTLSRQIKQLEQEVGEALFYRDNRSVRLTATGAAFVRYAKASLASWQQFKSECQDENAPLTGQLHLFCSVTASYSFVYQLFAEFRKRHPHVELHLTTGDPAQSIARVQKESADLAVAVKPAQLPNGLEFVALGKSSLHLIAPTLECPLTEQIQQGSRLAELTFIVAEEGVVKERFEQLAQQEGFVPKVYAYVAGHEALVALVSLGFGIALVPDVVLQQSPFKDKVQILPNHGIAEIEIGLVAQKRRVNEAVIQSFWLCSQEIFTP
ncbi:HTH-type transcriptional activator IlvY [Pseudoalteromonas fenneropenaei]|uniref:HTH-type transcriptional activator IlvY n=1 Tax=Pseudoalteromonas fenneropenaei TaxID=1737459 RepID=A0ABV7CI28_9GAMM